LLVRLLLKSQIQVNALIALEIIQALAKGIHTSVIIGRSGFWAWAECPHHASRCRWSGIKPASGLSSPGQEFGFALDLRLLKRGKIEVAMLRVGGSIFNYRQAV